jgi:hypothetical protein
MIKNNILLEQFERDLKRKEKPDYHRNMEIFEGMYKEAVYLNAIPLKDPLDGLEVDIKIARVIELIAAAQGYGGCRGIVYARLNIENFSM